jgi:hypothetical protein
MPSEIFSSLPRAAGSGERFFVPGYVAAPLPTEPLFDKGILSR